MNLQWSGGKRVAEPGFPVTAGPQRRACEGALIFRLTTHRTNLRRAVHGRQQVGLASGRGTCVGEIPRAVTLGRGGARGPKLNRSVLEIEILRLAGPANMRGKVEASGNL